MRGIKNTISILKKQYKKPSCARCLRLGRRKEINYNASIRQALYEYCIDHYMDIDADEKVMELMKAYPELEAVYIKRVEEKMAHGGISRRNTRTGRSKVAETLRKDTRRIWGGCDINLDSRRSLRHRWLL